jgi:protein SCO1/2
VKGCVYVAEYFFTTCQGICPVMNRQMERVQQAFAGERNFKILSHTVNPEYDSVAVMMDYAVAHHALRDKWYMLTGDKKMLYDVARREYYLNTEQGDGGPNDFIHTQNFALLDTLGRIRGYYDGTDSADVDRLIQDAWLLLKK